MTVQTSLAYAFLFQAVVGVIAPPLIAFYLDRRLHVGWRWIWYGALVFFAVEVLAMFFGAGAGFIELHFFGKRTTPSPVILGLLVAVFSGIVEEVGRYVGYRLFFRSSERDWDRAVMYGIGHGGFESMTDKTLRSLSAAAVVLFVPHLHAGDYGLTSASLTPLVQAWHKISAFHVWEPILGAATRIGGLALHVCFAVMVLQVFQRGSTRWLLLAIVFHVIVDTSIVIAAAYTNWAGELIGIVWIAAAAFIAFRLRAPTSPPSDEPTSTFRKLVQQESS